MTTHHVVCFDAWYREFDLGVADRVTVWCVAHGGRPDLRVVLMEYENGDVKVLWHHLYLLPCRDFADGLALLLDRA